MPVKAGDVYRMNGDAEAFGDCVVLSVSQTGTIKLARPYCRVSSAETLCPTALTGVEIFEVRAGQFADRFTKVGEKFVSGC